MQHRVCRSVTHVLLFFAATRLLPEGFKLVGPFALAVLFARRSTAVPAGCKVSNDADWRCCNANPTTRSEIRTVVGLLLGYCWVLDFGVYKS